MVERYQVTTTVTCGMQLSVYGASADWCGDSAQQITDHAFSGTGKIVAQTDEPLDWEFSFEVVSVLTKLPEMNVLSQGNLL